MLQAGEQLFLLFIELLELIRVLRSPGFMLLFEVIANRLDFGLLIGGEREISFEIDLPKDPDERFERAAHHHRRATESKASLHVSAAAHHHDRAVSALAEDVNLRIGIVRIVRVRIVRIRRRLLHDATEPIQAMAIANRAVLRS